MRNLLSAVSDIPRREDEEAFDGPKKTTSS
jgi:hypothetical protein